MKLLKNISIDGTDYKVLISDEAFALKEAKSRGIATVAIDTKGVLDLSLAEYAVEGLESIDDEFLKKVICRKHNKPLTILDTDRLSLRELTCDDYVKIESSQALSESERYFEDEATFLNYINITYRFFDYGIWAVEDKENFDFIGMAGLYFRNDKNRYFLSYFISPEYRNKGYAYEISKAIIKKVYKKVKPAIEIKKGNIASIKLAEKLSKYSKDMLKYSIDIFYLDVL